MRGEYMEIDVYDGADAVWSPVSVPEDGWMWVEGEGFFVIEGGVVVRSCTTEEEANIRGMTEEEVRSERDA